MDSGPLLCRVSARYIVALWLRAGHSLRTVLRMVSAHLLKTTDFTGTALRMTGGTMGTLQTPSPVFGTSDTREDLVSAAVSVRDMDFVPSRLDRRVTHGFSIARQNSSGAAIWSLEPIGTL